MKTNIIMLNNVVANVYDPYENNNEVSLEHFLRYVSDAKYILDFFGEDIITQVLPHIHFTDIAKRETVSTSTANYYASRGYVFADNKTHEYERQEYRGSWSRTVTEIGYKVWVPYQYFNNDKVIRPAMMIKYPWLKKFSNLIFYPTNHSDMKDYLFFLDCGKEDKGATLGGGGRKILYIYMKDFITGNFINCIKSHIEYHTHYYKWPGGWGPSVTEEKVATWRANSCAITTCDEAERFYTEMEINRLRSIDYKF